MTVEQQPQRSIPRLLIAISVTLVAAVLAALGTLAHGLHSDADGIEAALVQLHWVVILGGLGAAVFAIAGALSGKNLRHVDIALAAATLAIGGWIAGTALY